VCLSGADKGDSGEVIEALGLGEGQPFRAVPGKLSEFVRLLEDGAAEVEGRSGGKGFDEGGGSLDAEVLPVVAGFEDSLGDKEHARAGFEGLDGGLEGEVSEETEGHGDMSEDAGAVAVAEDCGLASGVDVGEEAESKVIAAEEGWGEARSAGGGVESLVDLVRQGSENVHHVDDFSGEELRDAEAKGVLRGGCDGVGVGACAGDVGEEEDEVRAGGYGVVEVATGARGEVAGVKIEPRDGVCMDFRDCTLSDEGG
jgi:hypothetical protein